MRVESIAGGHGVPITVHSVGSGPGLVVLHGAGVTVRDYRRLADRLAPRLTVRLFNRRGRHDSDTLPSTETAQTDLDDLAAVLAHTCARNLFGHNGGGFTLPLDRIATYDAAVALDCVDIPRGFFDQFDQALATGDLTEALVQAGKIHPDIAAAKMPHWLQVVGVRGFLDTRRKTPIRTGSGPPRPVEPG